MQTGSRVTDILPSADVTMTSDSPSDLVCESILTPEESRNQVDEVRFERPEELVENEASGSVTRAPGGKKRCGIVIGFD